MNEKDHEVYQKVLALLEEEYQSEFDQRQLGPVNLHFVKNRLQAFIDKLKSTVSERVERTPIRQILVDEAKRVIKKAEFIPLSQTLQEDQH